MGKRGPKPRFLDVACPNEKCSLFGVAGKGNVTVYATYERISGKGRKFLCHTCGTRFCDRTNTPYYDLRMSVLGIAETIEIKPSTASTWISRAGIHCEKVNEVVLNDVETPKVEMDELWTFVEKKRCPGKMNSKTTGLGSG
jgi:RecJ-like exonuclease